MYFLFIVPDAEAAARRDNKIKTFSMLRDCNRYGFKTKIYCYRVVKHFYRAAFYNIFRNWYCTY